MDPHFAANSKQNQRESHRPQATGPSTFSFTTAILSFFSPDNGGGGNGNGQGTGHSAAAGTGNPPPPQDWPTTSQPQAGATGNQLAEQQRDQEQQQQRQTLASCVESLIRSERARTLVGDLLDSAQLEPPRPPLASNQSLRLDDPRINWTQLGERLPAVESSYQLEALSEKWQFALALVYSVTAITSFVLNVVTVIVLIRSRRSELRKYLINLSLSDLLMSLFSIPFTYTEYMLGHWIFASFLCPVVRLVVTLSVFVSVATMTVIGINRHLAIMYPLKRKRCSRFQRWTIRKTHVIVAIWLLGMGISLPEFLMYSAQPFCYNRQLFYECRQSWGNSMANSYTIFIYMSTFVVPFSLLTYLYTCIGLKLWRREMPGNIDVNRDLTMQTQRTKVIKMLLVVVVLFAIFWLPLQTFSLVTFLYPNLREGIGYQSLEYNIFIGTYFASHWLSMAHSCLNPLIYCFMNDKFRNNLHSLICTKHRPPIGSAYSYSVSRISQHTSYLGTTHSNQFSANETGECPPGVAEAAPSETRKYRFYFGQSTGAADNQRQIVEHHHFHHYNRRRHSSPQNAPRGRDSGAAGPRTTFVEMVAKPAVISGPRKLSLDRRLASLLDGFGKQRPTAKTCNGEQVFMRIVEQAEPGDEPDEQRGLGSGRPGARPVGRDGSPGDSRLATQSRPAAQDD